MEAQHLRVFVDSIQYKKRPWGISWSVAEFPMEELDVLVFKARSGAILVVLFSSATNPRMMTKT